MLPPVHELAKQAGVNLPGYLGKLEQPKVVTKKLLLFLPQRKKFKRDFFHTDGEKILLIFVQII